MLLGVRDHLEIWDKGRWEQYLNQEQPRYDQLAENAFEAGIGTPRKTTPKTTPPTQTVAERSTIAESTSEHVRPTQPR
jgi:hypothetical protein